MPRALTATFSLSPGSSGSCACLDGAVISLSYDAGSTYSWTGTGSLGACGPTVGLRISTADGGCTWLFSFDCGGGAGFVSTLRTVSRVSCSPFHVLDIFSGLGGGGGATWNVGGSVGTGCGCSFPFASPDYFQVDVTE
jgi:hypothetical protein